MGRFWMTLRSISLISVVILFITEPTIAGENNSSTWLTNDGRINDDPGHAKQIRPVMAMSPSGFAVVCWQDYRDGNDRIYAQRIGHAGFAMKANFRAPNQPGMIAQLYPATAMSDLGHFVVIWEEYSDSARIYGQCFQANATPVGEMFQVNEIVSKASGTWPAVAMEDDGAFVVAWMDRRHAGYLDIYAQRFDSSGAKLGDNFKVNDSQQSFCISPAIDIHDNGRFVICWKDERNYGGEGDQDAIYAQRFDEQGVAVGGNLEIEPHVAGVPCASPSIAIQQNGNFFICWQGGLSSHIFGALLNPAGDKLTTPTRINNPNVGSTKVYCFNPHVSSHDQGGYVVVWEDSVASATRDIAQRKIKANGDFDGGVVLLNDPAGSQKFPGAATSYFSVTTVVWQDSRNGDDDIYATWVGTKAPINPKAGRGFDGMVPLSWDPIYNYGQIKKYIVKRSESPSGPFEQIGVVDLTERGAAGALMRDFIDQKVLNDQDYYYSIMADIPDPDQYQLSFIGKPSSAGKVLRSAWAPGPPLIDGRIEAGEWPQGATWRIESGGARFPIMLYIMNTSEKLYLAVDDPNDLSIDPGNLLGVLFDENHDGKWDATGPSREGMLQMTSANITFIGYWGSYPLALGADAVKAAAGISRSISTTSGHVQYEAAIDLTVSPLNATPGMSIGFCLWIADPGNYYSPYYGNAGQWPSGALWEAAESLGDLYIAAAADTVTTYDWPMSGGSRERTSWARCANELMPPFTNVIDLPTLTNEPKLLSGAGDDLFAGHSTTPSVLLHYDLNTQTMQRVMDIPGTNMGYGFNPAVADSLVIFAGCNGSTLYAMNWHTGEQKWQKAIGLVNFQAPILDGDRVFVVADSLFCLDILSGRTIWKQGFGGVGHGFTPTVDETTLFLTVAGELFAYNKLTGVPRWHIANNGQPSIAVDAECVYSNHADAIYARYKRDGSTKWLFPITGGGLGPQYSWFNRIAIDERFLCFTQHQNTDGVAQVVTLNKAEGTLRWRQQFGYAHASPPTIANGVVYLYAKPSLQMGPLYGFDLANRNQVFFDDSQQYFGQPIVMGQRLVAAGSLSIRVFSNDPATRVQPGVAPQPTDFSLERNYPNPFNPSTTIRYYLKRAAEVDLAIYNIKGQKIKTWPSGYSSQGWHEVVWQGDDDRKNPAGSGFYILKIRCGNSVKLMKMMLLR